MPLIAEFTLASSIASGTYVEYQSLSLPGMKQSWLWFQSLYKDHNTNSLPVKSGKITGHLIKTLYACRRISPDKMICSYLEAQPLHFLENMIVAFEPSYSSRSLMVLHCIAY